MNLKNKVRIRDNLLLFTKIVFTTIFTTFFCSSISLGSSFSIMVSVKSDVYSSIDYPVYSSVCPTIPTVVGNATPNKTVIIKGISGGFFQTVATTTSDNDGNFAIAVDPSTPLDVGTNPLTPFIEGVSGISVMPEVKASPTTDEVPVITSLENGQKITGNLPVIPGRGLAGSEVRLYMKLLWQRNYVEFANKITETDLNINHVASDIIGVDGKFNITVPDDFSPGAYSIYVVVNGVASAIKEVVFPNIYGIVYNSKTNEPIDGALLTLQRSLDEGATWYDTVPVEDIYIKDTNPQTTGIDGDYGYLTVNGDFRLVVGENGYLFPSTNIPMNKPQVGSHGELFRIDGSLLNILLPMDYEVVALISDEDVPEDFYLSNNFPNPFNSITTIQFHLPEVNFVTLNIYNIHGQKIKTLVNRSLQPGRYSITWDGTDNNEEKLPSGIYIYQIRAGDFQKMSKLLFLK